MTERGGQRGAGSVRLILGLAAGAFATTALGFVLGIPPLLPLLGAAVPYAVFLPRVRDQEYGAALGWVLVWAVFQSLALGTAAALFPERTREVVIHGDAYARDMLGWIRTGEGAEGSPRLYLPVHAAHYAVFCLVSSATAGAAGLVLGTALLNYMNTYVAELVRVSAHPAVALGFGWPIWAVLRVVGFVASGIAFAALPFMFLDRWRGKSAVRRFPVTLLLFGFGLVVVDAVLKALLAPAWRRILLRALGS